MLYQLSTFGTNIRRENRYLNSTIGLYSLATTCLSSFQELWIVHWRGQLHLSLSEIVRLITTYTYLLGVCGWGGCSKRNLNIIEVLVYWRSLGHAWVRKMKGVTTIEIITIVKLVFISSLLGWLFVFFMFLGIGWLT
jgi:hypothetical protein